MAIARNGHNGVHGTLAPGHYCPNCGRIVYPGTQNETATLAPEPGKSGNMILLRSFNSRLSTDDPGNPSRLAWCLGCDEWVMTKRYSVLDIRVMYASRDGVSFRFDDGRVQGGGEKRTKSIVNLINARIQGAGVLTRAASPKRRR